MVFVAAGIVDGPDVLDLVELDATHGTAFHVAELTLALLLFADAAASTCARCAATPICRGACSASACPSRSLVVAEEEPELPALGTILAAMTVTVLASVVLHGLTALPFVRAYARNAERLPADAPELSGGT